MLRKRYPFILLSLWSLVPFQLIASSYKIDNLEIPKQIALEETGDILNLQGVAKHKKYFQDDYVGAFYARNRLNGPSQALADTGPKRMWFYYFQASNNVRSDWEKLINDNNSPEVVERDQIKISQFLRMLEVTVNEGDVIMLDYIPNVGVKVTVKGSVRGIIKSNEVFLMLLKTWMGRLPPSEKFRKNLFNLSEGIHMGQLSL